MKQKLILLYIEVNFAYVDCVIEEKQRACYLRMQSL